MKAMRALAGALCVLCVMAGACAAATDNGVLPFSKDEIARILQHGPWPPPMHADTSNRVSGRPSAIEFGKRLFFDPRLSASATISCANCHIPELGWSDARARATGAEETDRNTMSVINARFNRWFGWSGASDSLWAASIRPLLDAREMGGAERLVAARVRAQPDLACGYRSAFGRAPPDNDETLIADIGKALAAFQEKLVTGRTPFDIFRDAIARGDRRAAARYPLAAQRGLRLFVGTARCNVCHFGPQFTNGEFDKTGISVRGANGHFDWGRYDGIKTLRANRFNLLSRHNDKTTRTNAISTRHVVLDAEAYGAFKVPTLRNVALTAPYMHDGRLASLRDVVRHYSQISEAKLAIALSSPHAEPSELFTRPPTGSVLQTLNLSDTQISDIVAFLETLTEPKPMTQPPNLTAAACR